MADVKAIAEQLVNLTVKEVNELADVLKEDYGIEPAAAAAPVMVAGGAGEAGAIGAPPAIINALVNALTEYNIDHIEMPATANKLWSILKTN